ncbi:MAG: hypothetical protein ACRBFS_12025 [Aureispira sp.]
MLFFINQVVVSILSIFELLTFISEINFAIGITINSSKELQLSLVYQLSEILDGKIFDGTALFNAQGELLLGTEKGNNRSHYYSFFTK